MNNTALGAENKKEQVNECRQYTVENLFCCAYAPFFWQAIQIRYPEYATYNRELYALWIVFCKYCFHRILSPYRPINHSLQKSEAFQSAHHVTFILCYNVL